MEARVACIVEGHGEVDSVPILLRRVAFEFDSTVKLVTPHPIRVTKGRLLRPGEMERAVRLAALNAGTDGAILVILDSDEDCPAEIGPRLLNRVRSTRSDLPSAVVLAKREFEAWFLASAESLRGHRGLSFDLPSPQNPEEIAGAKEWLSKRMAGGAYAATVDQAAFASQFDLAIARRAASFDKCYRDIFTLLAALRSRS